MYSFNYPTDTFGGTVGSVEEVRAARVDPSGFRTFFYSKGENKVYAKSIDMNGLPVIEIFDKIDSPQESLDKRVSQLEELIKGLIDKRSE